MLPIMLDVKDKLCVIIGGGNAAYRKAKTLLKNGAKVRVISPNLSEKFDGLDIEYIRKEYSVGDTKKCFVAVAATDDFELNQKIADDVKASEDVNLFIAADNRENSDFMFSAYTEFGDTKISVSTNGGYPMLGAKICERLESECARYDEINKILSDCRKRILQSKIDDEEKYKLMRSLISDELLDIENPEEFKNEIEKIMEQWI